MAASVRLNAEIYTSLLAAKTEQSDKVRQDIKDLSVQINSLV